MGRNFLVSLIIMFSAFGMTDIPAAEKLTGTVIGTDLSVDYTTFQSSTTVNTRDMAFDGDPNTYFASYDRSYTWVGLDLGTQHVITRIGWTARNDDLGPNRMILGFFEGADQEDFSDALPLYIITQAAKIGEMTYADIDNSKGFRYVRYVGPSDARCNVAEIEFYGEEGKGDNSHLYQITNLPTVSIKTANNQEPQDKENNIDCVVSIISENGTKLLQEQATVRLRGNASMEFPKKPYRIKFEKKQRVLDAPEKAKKWTLINNYGDKTLMRNTLAFELSRQMGMPYTPYCSAVDVTLNGEYKGCYQLCDQVEAKTGRVEIEEMTTKDNDGEQLTGGYFIEVDAYAFQEKSMFYSDNGTPVTIKSPDEDSITTQQHNYIQRFYSEMEKNWRKTLDLNTFLRHFLVGELSGNTDTYWSVFMYKQRGVDSLYTGPVWDFDLAFDNDQRIYPVNNKPDYIYRSGGSYAGYMKTLVDQIVIQDSVAKQQLRDLYSAARNNTLATDSLLSFINKEEEHIRESAELNFIRWPIMNQRVHQNPKTWGSFEKEVENVRSYISKRIEWMDRKLNYTPPTDYMEQLSTCRIDYSLPCDVYSVGGLLIAKQIHINNNTLPAGVYILQQNNNATIIIR